MLRKCEIIKNIYLEKIHLNMVKQDIFSKNEKKEKKLKLNKINKT